MRFWFQSAALATAGALASGVSIAAPPTGSASPTTQALVAPRPEAPPQPREPRSLGARSAHTALALVPGVAVHGTGHFARGDSRTGWMLLAGEGIGASMTVGGLAGLALTGAARRYIIPFTWITGAGFGLFLMSWLADIYGSAAPDDARGLPRRALPLVEAELGYRYVSDRVFDYRHLTIVGADFRSGWLRLRPRGSFALGVSNRRLELLAAARLIGARGNTLDLAGDGSHLDLELELSDHDYGEERFSLTTGSFAVAGRLDHANLSPSLRGSFSELALGWGVQATRYRIDGVPSDVDELLLMRFGHGFWFGDPRGVWGEAMAYYDHRHDGYVAGTKLPGLGSGVAGHFGLRALGWFGRRFGALAEIEAGSAWYGGVSLLVRSEGTR